MKTQIRIINEMGKAALALIKFIPENNEDSLLLKRAVELNYEEGDSIELNRLISSAVLTLKRDFKPLESTEINTSFETIVKMTKL